MIGLEMLMGCQHRHVYQTMDLGCTGEAEAREKNFRITFLEVCFGGVEVF